MANNYTQYSEMIRNITPEEKQWIEAVLKNFELDDGDVPPGLEAEWNLLDEDTKALNQQLHSDDYEEGYTRWLGFSAEVEDDGLWLYSEEGSDLEKTATFVQAFLKRFRPDDHLIISYAEWCSKLRLSEFGGGAVLITAESSKWFNPTYEAEKAFKAMKAQE
jgi:hypothetical protein